MNDMVLKVTYVGTKGTYLPRTQTHQPPRHGQSARSGDELRRSDGPPVSIHDGQRGLNGNSTTFSNRYDPRYNAVNYVESSANSSYNSLQVELQKRFGSHFFANLAYTWAHSIDDNSDVLGVLQMTPRRNRIPTTTAITGRRVSSICGIRSRSLIPGKSLSSSTPKISLRAPCWAAGLLPASAAGTRVSPSTSSPARRSED